MILILVSLTSSGQCARNKIIWRDRRALTEVPPDIPDDATEVHLEWNSITTLQSRDFSNLHDCSVMLLYVNSISQIQPEAFVGLDQLLELDLSDNSISRLESRTFLGLSRIEELLLYFNNIQDVKEDMWEGLDSLKYLGISNNEIDTIQTGSFSNLVNL